MLSTVTPPNSVRTVSCIRESVSASTEAVASSIIKIFVFLQKGRITEKMNEKLKIGKKDEDGQGDKK